MSAVAPFVITVGMAALILVFGVYYRGGRLALVREAPSIGRLLLGTVLIATIFTLITSVGGHGALAVWSTIAMTATVGTLGIWQRTATSSAALVAGSRLRWPCRYSS